MNYYHSFPRCVFADRFHGLLLCDSPAWHTDDSEEKNFEEFAALLREELAAGRTVIYNQQWSGIQPIAALLEAEKWRLRYQEEEGKLKTNSIFQLEQQYIAAKDIGFPEDILRSLENYILDAIQTKYLTVEYIATDLWISPTTVRRRIKELPPVHTFTNGNKKFYHPKILDFLKLRDFNFQGEGDRLRTAFLSGDQSARLALADWIEEQQVEVGPTLLLALRHREIELSIS